MMEENGPNVVKMAIECKKAASCLVRPDLDLVIVTAGDEKRLCLVEIDSTDGPVVLFEAINQCSHSVIPELDGGRV
jgi:hypothetical protein